MKSRERFVLDGVAWDLPEWVADRIRERDARIAELEGWQKAAQALLFRFYRSHLNYGLDLILEDMKAHGCPAVREAQSDGE